MTSKFQASGLGIAMAAAVDSITKTVILELSHNRAAVLFSFTSMELLIVIPAVIARHQVCNSACGFDPSKVCPGRDSRIF